MVQAKTYIVCVGIADYPGNANDLKQSVNDAILVKNLYERNGEAVVSFLSDQRATVKKIQIVMQNLFCRARKEDTVVFYFSGHGVSGGFLCYDGILTYEAINRSMRFGASNRVVMADACLSGGARTTNRRKHRNNSTNVMFFLSSRSNEVSLEPKIGTNSIFTEYLGRALSGEADMDKNKIITAKELFDYVSKEVTKESDGKQHPVMWGNFCSSMPVFIWKN